MITRRDLHIVSAFGLACIAFFSVNIFGGESFFLRDIAYLFHPWKALVSELLQKGSAPLWNPYVFCGMPLSANWQTAVFYPFSLLFYFFDFAAALKAFHPLHIFAAGFFAYIFGRKAGLSRYASAVMMLIFAFNGYIVTRMEFLSHLSVDVWIFLILILIRRPFLLAGALSISFLGGHQVFFMQLLAAALYLCFENKDGWPGTWKYLAGAALFACLVSIQLLPTYELARLTSRAKEGLDLSVATTHSVKPSDLLRLFGSFLPASELSLTAGERLSWTNTFTVGIFAVIAAGIGLFRAAGFKRTALFAVILLASGIFLSLGKYNPLYTLIYNAIPFMKLFRYPVQFMYLAVIGISLLAALGMNQRKFAPLFALFIAVELFISCIGFQATAPDGFFRVNSGAAAFLSGKGGRFILSPGTEKDRQLPGPSVPDAWQNARGYLYNLTCMPYHIENAYGVGEPLVLSGVESLVNTAYTSDSAAGSLKYFRELGAEYLVCRNKLKDPGGFILLVKEPPFIYSIPNSAGKHLFDGKISGIYQEEGGYSARLASSKPSEYVIKESFYPGWKAFLDGNPLRVDCWNGVFRKMHIPAGSYTMRQVFLPASFSIGLMLTATAIAFLGIFGVFSLKKMENTL